MANPLYGQNKADSSIDNISAQWKVLRYVVADIDDTGITNGSAVVAEGIPGYFVPVLCSVRNMSETAADDFGAVACLLDVETSGQKLTTTLSGLGDGESIHCVCSDEAADQSVARVYSSAALDILAEAADFKSAAGKTVSYEITVSGWDMSASVSGE